MLRVSLNFGPEVTDTGYVPYSSIAHSDADIMRTRGANRGDAAVMLIDAGTHRRIDQPALPDDLKPVDQNVQELTDLFDPSERDQVELALANAARFPCTEDGLLLKNGQRVSLEIFRLPDHPAVIASIIRPETRKVHEAGDSLVAALDLSEEQFRLLAEALPMGVFVWGTYGVIRFANQRGRELLGLHGHAHEWHRAFDDDDWKRVEAAIVDLPVTRGIDVEVRLKHSDGDVRWRRLIVRDVRALDGSLLSAIGLIEDITEQRAMRTALEDAATRDALTGLPNRVMLMERLDAALAQTQRNVSVLFIDLDGFKLVNDTLGHTIGDGLLQVVAERFSASIRPSDMVARFGGDEFVVVAEADTPNAPLLLAKRIHAVLAEPVLLGNRAVDVTASIGIANAEEMLSTPDQVLGDADLAMYAAKHAGRNRTVVYSPGLREAAAQEFDLIADLRHAIERHQAQLHYQPIYDLIAHAAIGAEALIRWEHPAYGRLLPNAFIRLAEENGLINTLGDWALQRACADLAELRRNGLVDDDFFVSINVSMLQLSAVNNLIATAEAAVKKHALRPDHLLFELTESVPLDAIPKATEQIRELNKRGFRLAVDDFGTGYSSLEYLTLLPFDVLKIDPSFTSRLGAPGGAGAAEAVLESLVHLSKRLDFELICEGIESGDQLSRVIGTTVRLGQGYFFARPAPLDRFMSVLCAAQLPSIDLTDPARSEP